MNSRTIYRLNVSIIFFAILCLASGAGFAQTVMSPQVTPVNPAVKPAVPTAILQGQVSDGQISNVRSLVQTPWRLGSYVRIAWDWPGHEANLKDVAILKDTPQGPAQVASVVARWNKTDVQWLVPNTLAPGPYYVKVSSSSNPQNTARMNVAVDYTTIAVTSPKANQLVIPGTTANITWTYQGRPDKVKIEYRMNFPGEMLKIIASGISAGTVGNGSYAWNVPKDLAEGYYTLMISGYNNPGVQPGFVSNVYVAKPLSITSPLSKSTFFAANQYCNCIIPVRWKYLPNIDVGTKLDIMVVYPSTQFVNGQPTTEHPSIYWSTNVDITRGKDDVYVLKGYVGNYDLVVKSKEHPEYFDRIPIYLDCKCRN